MTATPSVTARKQSRRYTIITDRVGPAMAAAMIITAFFFGLLILIPTYSLIRTIENPDTRVLAHVIASASVILWFCGMAFTIALVAIIGAPRTNEEKIPDQAEASTK